MIFTGSAFAQRASTSDSLIGTWKVVSARMLPDLDKTLDKEDIKAMALICKNFTDATFSFNKDKKFFLTFPPTIPAFMKEMEFLNNKKWRMTKGSVEIGTVEDGYSLMKIIIEEQPNKIFFLLDESPFLLEMVKL